MHHAISQNCNGKQSWLNFKLNTENSFSYASNSTKVSNFKIKLLEYVVFISKEKNLSLGQGPTP